MRLRTCAWLLVLPLLLSGTAGADVFWYTSRSATAGDVRSFDFDPTTATGTFGGPVTADPLLPLVDDAYTGPTASVLGIDTLIFGSGVGPILAYCDNPFVCIVDTDPASATFNTVLQTIDMRNGTAGDNPGVRFCRFHPGGGRIYATCGGGGSTIPSIRIARLVTPLPAIEYDFDPVTYPGDELNNAAAPTTGEWSTLPSTPFISSPTVHSPWGIDIDPGATKVYWTCHTEGGGAMHSNVHFFAVDTSGNFTGNGNVAEPPDFDHPWIPAVSPSALPFASGGSRMHVVCNFPPDIPGAPPPPDPGFVMLVNTSTDAAVGRVMTGLIPPNIDPAVYSAATTPAFDSPYDCDWDSLGTSSYVSDVDSAVGAGATDGIIAARVLPGSPSPDVTTDYFDDPTPATSADPGFAGVAVDNDDAEIVFCDQGTVSLIVYDVSGVVLGSFPTPTPLLTPFFIIVQSGTGSGGGGGGPPPGPGGSPTNDNGAETVGSDEYDDDDGGGHKKWYQCFVATASWGRESRPVGELISFRSDWIHGAQAGRVFDRMYYGFGPKLAGQITAHDAQPVGQVVLAPFAYAARGGAVTGAVAAILVALLVAMAVRRVL